MNKHDLFLSVVGVFIGIANLTVGNTILGTVICAVAGVNLGVLINEHYT